VLLDSQGTVKLCDFGSATSTVMQASSSADVNRFEDEVQRATTLMYRAPEMIDLYARQRIDTQVDVWALGCLLFKIAFRVTPFEDNRLQILNNNYEIPTASPFSPQLHETIKWILNPDPEERPDVWDVIHHICKRLQKKQLCRVRILSCVCTHV
jgi:AP2-associated kinase